MNFILSVMQSWWIHIRNLLVSPLATCFYISFKTGVNTNCMWVAENTMKILCIGKCC